MQITEIKDFQAPELDAYARCSEVQLLRANEPKPGLFIAESPKVIARAVAAGYEPVSVLIEKRQLAMQSDEVHQVLKQLSGIPVYTAESEVLTRLTGFQLTRGMLCLMKRKVLPELPALLSGARRIVLLENVANPTNIGAIFRSAAALGMDAVILTGGSSDPLYRRASRVSMGTVFQVPWTMLQKKGCAWPKQAFDLLKKEGFRTAAMALKEDTLGIDDPMLRAEKKLAMILGTEGEGLMEETIRACDYTVKIPMMHGVDSLNVAAASAVAFWELSK